MVLKPELTKFTTASPITATYNFSDVENGIGISTYYCIAYQTSATGSGSPVNNYDLSDILIEGDNTGISSASLNLSPFNVQKTVNGKGWFEGSHKTGQGAYGFKVQRVSGAVVTDLNTEVFSKVITTGGTKIAVSFDLARTVFKKGDYLRFVVRALTSGDTVYLNSTKAATALILIPFEVSL